MKIRKYLLSDGRRPFDIWMSELRDLRAKAKILIRLKRLELGNLGDVKPISNGVHELRIYDGHGLPGLFWNVRARSCIVVMWWQ